MEDKHPKNLEDVYEIILMRNADNFKMSREFLCNVEGGSKSFC